MGPAHILAVLLDYGAPGAFAGDESRVTLQRAITHTGVTS